MSLCSTFHLTRAGVLGVAFLAAASPVEARTRLELGGPWQFRTDPAGEGQRLGWPKQPPDGTETVAIPHTWNVGAHVDYEGSAWYFKSFTLDEALLHRHAELHFGATFYRARVWLNGEELGGHEGGYTGYFLDVTKRLRPVNHLAVELDNRPGYRTIPGWAMRGRGTDDSGSIWYDWWHYGGIVRPVWLTLGDASVFRRQRIRTRLGDGAAEIEDRVFLENTSEVEAPLRLRVSLYELGSSAPAATAERRLSLPPGAHSETVVLELESPKLWHFDHPNLYRMEAELIDPQGRLVDSRSDEFGVRSIEIRDRHLYLNGERVRLSGMTRHADSPREGLAETRGTIVSDYADMKDLQVTLSRPVHYPQDPAILEYCDRNGILLIPEIPVWQFSEQQLADPQVLELAKRMAREMVEQDGNHPSIMAWSLCNESATGTAGGYSYVKAMYDWVKSLDPDRYVSFADDGLGRSEPLPAHQLVDFVMMNEYYGSWHGTADALTGVLERLGRLYPDKLVIVSEFGFPGVFAADSASADRKRVEIVREQLATFGKYDWIAGAILWCYQDYRSHRNLWPGETQGWVDIGLVDEDRQRRPSYHVWRELNSPLSVDVQWTSTSEWPHPAVGFKARVSERGPSAIPSYPLHGYRLTWEAKSAEGQVVGSGQAVLSGSGPTEIAGTWPAPPASGVVLVLEVYRPRGFVAFERTYEWRGPVAGGESIGDMQRRGLDVPPPER